MNERRRKENCTIKIYFNILIGESQDIISLPSSFTELMVAWMLGFMGEFWYFTLSQ